ncbi:hypothetical protein PtA15_8A387 [Puccinia triticina]|uniref:Uncharacterized protein n=1 Tax=Puccinia triticina TaxID=208348 RepID=A0ABY7CRC0_9BASI|nr:uncharacterized protein PtA15_8A387 [Puccinia triticina]WAQ87483.1 hypothetical protein PtA15_8A387 [Puccinia triticina]
MQFTTLAAALAVCTGVFASPLSQQTNTQAAAQAGQAGQWGPFYGGYPYGGFYGNPYGYNRYGWCRKAADQFQLYELNFNPAATLTLGAPHEQ